MAFVMNEDEMRAFQELQGEHDAFWQEQYQSYQTPLKERVWEWCSDHQMVLTIAVAVLLVAVLIFLCFHPMALVIVLIAGLCGLVAYMIFSFASGIVQTFLEWLM